MLPPQNWYLDPGDGTRLRWWDGQAWTQNTVPNPAAPGFVPTRRRIWPWAVAGVAGFLALVGIGAAVFIPRVIHTFKDPIDAANVYLREWHADDRPAAYTHLCARKYGGLSYDRYLEAVQAQDAQTGRLLRFNARVARPRPGSANAAIVDVDITTTRGSGVIDVDMVKENGRWRWCGWLPAPGANSFTVRTS